MCSHYRSQEKKVNGKDCRCPTLEAVRKSVEYNFSVSSSQTRNISTEFHLSDAPKTFFLSTKIFYQEIWIKASYKFIWWLDLRPSWFENEKKSFGTFHFNFSHILILTFYTQAIKADVSPCNYLMSILTFSCTLNNIVNSGGDCTMLKEVLGRLINGEVYVSGGGGD